MSGDEVVARARACVGVPFRLHGWGTDGLDCVGLVAVATGLDAPIGYGLRSGDVAQAEAGLRAAGLRMVAQGCAGDVALVRPGPVQLHLMIACHGGFVHAHAGLRRVVEMPGGSPWPVLSWWRV
jgi:hypothetical protein